MMRALAISGSALMKVLYAIEPYSPHHGEVSEAIAMAANQDPLWPSREDGCFRTAAILVALAWYGSRFQPSLVGENGKAFGLFQVRPPPVDANGKVVTTNMLTNPRDASLVTIDLVRQSMFKAQGRSWEEQLSAFMLDNGAANPHDAVKRGMDRMLLSDKIVKDHFPEYRSLQKPVQVEARQLPPAPAR